MARNTGRGSRAAVADPLAGRFLEAKPHGGAFGRRDSWWRRLLRRHR